MIARVSVGPFRVADVGYRDAVREAASLALDPPRARRFYALHVGGLNARGDAAFVDEMNDAELVCADGGSVVLLARLAGARQIERTPTTDAGWDVLAEVSRILGRPARTALVGGEPLVVDIAARALEAGRAGETVMVAHGYRADWSDVMARITAAHPDVLVLGLGAPREMLWVREFRDDLPPCLVITCGGWFGFLAGTERRAPRLLRRSGLEWIARVAQAPARLFPRYGRGVATCAAIAGGTVFGRRPRRLS